MKKIYLPLFLLFISLAATAQSYYEISIPGTNAEANSVIQNHSGNYVMTGYSFVSGSNADVFIYEIDSASGVVLRSKQIITPNLDMALSVCNTSDSGYLISGYYKKSSTDNDLFVARLDSALNFVWYKTMGIPSGNDYGNSVQEISPDRYALTGTVAIGGSAKPSLIMLDASGAIVYERYLNTNQFASPSYKAKYLGEGKFGFIHLSNSFCLMDSTGAILKNDPNSVGVYSTDIIKNPNGEFAVIAATDYGSPQGGTIGLCLFDTAGTNIVMQVKISVTGADLSPSCLIYDNGDYIIAANGMNQSTGAYTAFLFKVNSAGSIVWGKSLTPTGSAQSKINSLTLGSDGSYLLAGSEGSLSNTNFFFVKSDSTGNVCQSTNIAFTKLTLSLISATVHTFNSGAISTFSTSNPPDSALTATSVIVCTALGIEENINDNSFSVYPNPVSDIIRISTELKGGARVHIYSGNGELIVNQELNFNRELNVQSLPAGIYFMQLIDSDGKTEHRIKFVKMN